MYTTMTNFNPQAIIRMDDGTERTLSLRVTDEEFRILRASIAEADSAMLGELVEPEDLEAQRYEGFGDLFDISTESYATLEDVRYLVEKVVQMDDEMSEGAAFMVAIHDGLNHQCGVNHNRLNAEYIDRCYDIVSNQYRGCWKDWDDFVKDELIAKLEPVDDDDVGAILRNVNLDGYAEDEDTKMTERYSIVYPRQGSALSRYIYIFDTW